MLDNIILHMAVIFVCGMICFGCVPNAWAIPLMVLPGSSYTLGLCLGPG